MIGVEIKILDIDYNTTFQNLFPKAMKECEKMETSNLLVRFLQKMEDASMPAAQGILNLLPEKSKGELLCKLVNMYAGDLRELFNHYLAEDEIGKNIQLGDIVMMQEEEGSLTLGLRDVRIDYNNLVQNEEVRQKIGDVAMQMAGKLSGSSRLKQLAAHSANLAVRAVVAFSPEEVEKQGIAIISKETCKTRLLAIAVQAMEKKGIYISLEDFVPLRESKEVDEASDKRIGNTGLVFSDELEEALLVAITEYLKILLNPKLG